MWIDRIPSIKPFVGIIAFREELVLKDSYSSQIDYLQFLYSKTSSLSQQKNKKKKKKKKEKENIDTPATDGSNLLLIWPKQRQKMECLPVPSIT